jgi:hypothetical protein
MGVNSIETVNSFTQTHCHKHKNMTDTEALKLNSYLFLALFPLF